MHFIIHKRIVLTKVSDVNLLVATREAWDDCPYVIFLSPIEATFWHFIENGVEQEEIYKEIESNQKKDVLKSLYHLFIKKMKENGYIIGEED